MDSNWHNQNPNILLQILTFASTPDVVLNYWYFQRRLLRLQIVNIFNFLFSILKMVVSGVNSPNGNIPIEWLTQKVDIVLDMIEFCGN